MTEYIDIVLGENTDHIYQSQYQYIFIFRKSTLHFWKVLLKLHSILQVFIYVSSLNGASVYYPELDQYIL